MARTYDEILKEMLDKFEELAGMAADDASDVGIRMRVLAGQVYSLETQTDWLERQCFPETAAGEYLDRHALQRNIKRKAESKAVGKLFVSASSPAAAEIIVPAGLIAAGSGKTRYKTVEQGVIPPGETGVLVNAEACSGGPEGNAAALTINSPVTLPPGVSGVTNPEPFTGGRRAETDEQFRKRLLLTYSDMPNGANAAFYRELVMQNPEVLCASVVCAAPGESGVLIYILSRSGEKTPELLSAVRNVLYDKEPVGVNISLRYGDVFNQNVSAHVEIKPGFNQDDVIKNCKTEIEEHISSLMLGEDLLAADLAEKIYHVSGVKNYWINEPADDVSKGASIKLVPGAITVEAMN